MLHQPSVTIGIVLFPNFIQLDFAGAYEVFTRLPNAKVHLLAPTLDPIFSECGRSFMPTTSFERVMPTTSSEPASTIDVLFVPGGLGVNNKLEDVEFLDFLKFHGDRAQYITSVASGSLLLAASGLLQGYRATTHQFDLEFLSMLKVEVVKERVVCDRDRITSRGGTAGIDLGLVLAAKLFGDTVAQEIQLYLEHVPAPSLPDDCWQMVNPFIVKSLQAQNQPLLEMRRQIVQRIARKFC